MKRKIFIFLIKLFGYERRIKLANKYWPSRWDEMNMSDFVTVNFQQEQFISIKLENGQISDSQPGHYIKKEYDK